MNCEWTYEVSAENISVEPYKISISASEQERKDVARRLALDGLDELSASLTLERQGNIIHVSGDFKALVNQKCVISLDLLDKTVADSFEAWYADPEDAVSLAKVRHERLGAMMDAELPLLEERDDPERIVDGKIDVGELVVQYLSLALEAYPHGEGIAYETGVDTTSDAEKPVHKPFAALKDWKKDKK